MHVCKALFWLHITSYTAAVKQFYETHHSDIAMNGLRFEL